MLRNATNIRLVLTRAMPRSASICRTKTTLSTQPTTTSALEASKVIRRQIGSTGSGSAASVSTSVSKIPVAETSVSVKFWKIVLFVLYQFHSVLFANWQLNISFTYFPLIFTQIGLLVEFSKYGTRFVVLSWCVCACSM